MLPKNFIKNCIAKREELLDDLKYWNEVIKDGTSKYDILDKERNNRLIKMHEERLVKLREMLEA